MIKMLLWVCIQMNIGERVFISQLLTLRNYILQSVLQFAPPLPSCPPVFLPVQSHLRDLGAVRSACRSSLYTLASLFNERKQLPASLIQLCIYTHRGPFCTTNHRILQPIMELSREHILEKIKNLSFSLYCYIAGLYI